MELAINFWFSEQQGDAFGVIFTPISAPVGYNWRNAATDNFVNILCSNLHLGPVMKAGNRTLCLENSG
jgi:hypothetical protein